MAAVSEREKNVESKECTKCGQVKLLSEFHKHKGGRDGLFSRCKSCGSEYDRKYRQKMRQRINVLIPDEKRCHRCGQTKAADEFSKHKERRDGLCPQCKSCSSEYGRKYYQKHREEIRAKSRRYYQEYKEEIRVRSYERHLLHPERIKAVSELNHAIEAGRIARPEICSTCDQKSEFPIEGHHPDYSKPLEVIWLCKSCHSELHRNSSNL